MITPVRCVRLGAGFEGFEVVVIFRPTDIAGMSIRNENIPFIHRAWLGWSTRLDGYVVRKGVCPSLKLVPLWWSTLLLEAPNTFDHLRVWDRFANNCLFKKSVEKLATRARGSSVEAEGEFIKVVVKVFSG